MHPISVTAAILAGGRGARLGGRDKPLEELAGKPLIAHILDALRPQVERIIISANRHAERYAAFGVPVFSDDVPGLPGPLAGMHTALCRSDTSHVLFLPGDAPFVDSHYAARLSAALQAATADAAVAVCDGRVQPVHCLASCSLRESIAESLAAGHRSVKDWLQRVGAVGVDYSDAPRQFMNLNTADDLSLLSAALNKPPPGECR
jgi:molybdopterin-guanine dinucleotide biosynthesis protein A